MGPFFWKIYSALFRGYKPLGGLFWLSFFLLFVVTAALGVATALELRRQEIDTVKTRAGTLPLTENPNQPPNGVIGWFYASGNFQKPFHVEHFRVPFSFRQPVEFEHIKQTPVTARFTADINFPRRGNYRFLVDASDGARVWVDGKKVFDQWKDTSAIRQPSEEFLVEKGWRSLRVDWRDKDNNGWLGLWWEGPGVSLAFIPPERMRPAQLTKPAP